MVQITKNGIVLLIPRSAYEADYKNNGWKIVGEEKKEVKPVSDLTPIEKNNKVNDSKKNKDK